MQNQRVVLFVRIDERLKNNIEADAKANARSVTKHVEHILKQNFEVEENGTNAEPAGPLRKTAWQRL